MNLSYIFAVHLLDPLGRGVRDGSLWSQAAHPQGLPGIALQQLSGVGIGCQQLSQTGGMAQSVWIPGSGLIPMAS